MASPDESAQGRDGATDVASSQDGRLSGVSSPLQADPAGIDQVEPAVIYDGAPIGLTLLSPDCRLLSINQRLSEMWDISSHHVGQPLRTIAAWLAGPVESIVQQVLRTGGPLGGVELSGTLSGGSRSDRVWLTNWCPLKNARGSIMGVNGAVEEITERKRFEATLATGEERYRALVRATSSLVWTTAPDGQIVDMPEWRAYTGLSVEQIRGWGWLDSLHPDDRQETAVVWQRAVDTRSVYETEYRIRRGDGIYVWHQARAVAILHPDRSIREWVGICLDIDVKKRATERQIEAENALRALNESLEKRVESEARERARIWNVSQDMLVVTDTAGNVQNLNPAWTSTLGWSESELVGSTWEWLLHPDDRRKVRGEQAQLAATGGTQRFENRLRHKDGSFRWVSWTAVADRGLIYAVARDITEFKAAADELRSSRQELARVHRQMTMGAMTASIAHEINQPLTAIVLDGEAGAQWLRNNTPNLDEAGVAFKRIIAAAHRASQVIGTVRAMFRKEIEQREAIDVNELLREVFVLLGSELQKNQVAVNHELAKEAVHVVADRVQLQQVILNLAMNAIEAMSSVNGRSRTLRVKSEMGGPAGVIVTFEDCGTGIDPSDIDRLFEPFFTTKTNGMGMGLSICRSIVEAHGGTISATPAHPSGSIFQIVLPSQSAAPVQPGSC
jgi:PAS domain S-box-containing protein